MTGFVLATADEAHPLIELLDARKLCDEPFVTYAFDASSEWTEGVIVISEMGGDNAAAATEYLIDDRHATTVVNVGICGALSDETPVGQLYRIAQAVDGQSVLADGEIRQWMCAFDLWTDLPAGRLASVPEPVFQADRREKLTSQADVVDMEGAAVAEACSARGIRCYMLKGVSDLANHTGKDDIRKNIAAVSEKLTRVLASELPHADQPRRTGTTAAAGLMRFTRIEHTVFSLPLLFSGAWIGARRSWPGFWILALIVLAGVGARCLGMAMNRILDRDLDALNKRTASRELPAGRMSLGGAFGVAAVGLGLYLLACWGLGPICLMLSPVPAVALIAYSLLKRFTNLCHFGIGLCLALAPLGAFVAASKSVAVNAEIILLALFAFCWISGADIVYGLMDIDSDKKTGVHSIPVSLGPLRAQLLAAGVHLTGLAAIAGLWLMLGGQALGTLAVVLSAGAFGVGYIQRIPVGVRFFPVFAIAGVSGSLVPLLGAT